MTDDSDIFDDEGEISTGDSAILKKGDVAPHLLKVYEAGELTVVGFEGQDIPDETCIAEYRDQLIKLVDDHRCKTLAFDLRGVKMLPSGMLGLLITMKKRGVQVELFNPSDDIRQVLKMTRLDTQLVVHEMEE